MCIGKNFNFKKSKVFPGKTQKRNPVKTTVLTGLGENDPVFLLEEQE